MNNELLASFGKQFLYDSQLQPPFSGFFALFGIVLAAVVIWTIIWKGMALWKAARSGQKKWFIALLLLNTIGILDILYIYVFSKKRKK